MESGVRASAILRLEQVLTLTSTVGRSLARKVQLCALVLTAYNGIQNYMIATFHPGLTVHILQAAACCTRALLRFISIFLASIVELSLLLVVMDPVQLVIPMCTSRMCPPAASRTPASTAAESV